MTYAQFVAKYNGKKVDTDGYPANQPYQCVDLAKRYLNEVFGMPIKAYGDACAYWNNSAILAKFDRVANGPTNIPKQGDIMVYQCSTPGSGGAGHIEIFDRKNGAGSFIAFSQNWGGAYAHMVTHSDNYKYVIGWLTPKQPPTQGATMAGISDDVSRQIGFHFLGRNGKDGKPNALQNAQGDIIGKELSNAQMSAFFLSAESRDWRDSRLPKVYAERDALKATNANLNTQITQLTKAVTDAQTKLSQANASIIGLTQTVNEKQAEISSLQDANADLTKENAELKAIIATGGAGNEDTEWLNKVGVALRWLINRLGLK